MNFSMQLDEVTYRKIQSALSNARRIGWRRDPLNPFQKVQNYMFKSTREKFQAEGISPQGGGKWWKKWTTYYAWWRVMVMNSVFPILQLKGTSPTGKGRSYNRELIRSIKKVSPNRRLVLLKTKVGYAAVHQYGSKLRNIPARPFFLWTPKDKRVVRKIFKMWIIKTMAYKRRYS